MRLRRNLVSVAFIFGVISCSGATEPPAVASVAISPNTSTLASGATVQLAASVLGDNGKSLTGKTVLWSSSNTQVASVSQTGLVTAGSILSGTSENVTISASVDGITGALTLSVQPVPVASVSVSSTKTTIPQTDTVRVSAEVKGAGGQALTGRTIEWTVSDTSMASVSSSGLVTSKKSSGVIVVQAKVGGVSGTASLTAICFHRPVGGGINYAGTVDNTDCPSASAGLFYDSFRFSTTQSAFIQPTVTLSASTSATLGVSVVQDTSLRHFSWDFSQGGSGQLLSPVLYGKGTFRMALRSETVGQVVPYTYRLSASSAVTSGCEEMYVVIGQEVLIDRNLNTCPINQRNHHYYTFYLVAGQQVTLDATSTLIDSYMCLGASGANAWTTCVDDYLFSFDSKINFTVASTGWYDFVVTTSAADNSSGVYRLKIVSSPVFLMGDLQQIVLRPKSGIRAQDRPMPVLK
jgi:hypothetical protein